MKILIIRFSSIGDIVLTSPVIRCLKQQLKNAEIHFLVKKNFAAVIENNPFIDKKIFYDDNFSEIIRQLKSEHYDVVIDLQKNFRSFRIRKSLRVKSYTFNKLNFKKWLFVNFKINLLPNIHIVDRYMSAVKSLGVVNDGCGLDYFITAENENAVDVIPDRFKKNYVAWVIGAKHFTKRLPLEKMISISKKINSKIILVGGNEDVETGNTLAASDSEKIYNACGKFSLNESAAVVKNAARVITHDTGLMHIAAAFKKEIISVWGNTVPEFGMYPYFGFENAGEIKSQIPIANGTKVKNKFSVVFQVSGLSCRPCSKIGFEKCPKGHFKCMKEIDEGAFEGL